LGGHEGFGEGVIFFFFVIFFAGAFFVTLGVGVGETFFVAVAEGLGEASTEFVGEGVGVGLSALALGVIKARLAIRRLAVTRDPT
jgi:hypothetical protein